MALTSLATLTLAIMVHLEPEAVRAPHTDTLTPEEARAPAVPALRPEALVDQNELLATLRSLPTTRAARGDDRTLQDLRHTEKLIVDRLRALGLNPKLEEVDALGARRNIPPASAPPAHDAAPASEDQSPVAPSPEQQIASRTPWHNISVDLVGTSVPNEILIVGAHIDAVPESPGADDDGTGVAALLEAARVLKDRPTQRTIRLVFFNLEEVGLVGSRVHAANLQPELRSGAKTIVGMVSLDMLGFYIDAPNSQKSPLPPIGSFKPPTVGNFLAMGGVLRHRAFSQALNSAMLASEPALRTFVLDFLPFAPPDLLRSDHAPFLEIGVPAVILSDTANFRNPHYHTPSDDLSTIDMPRFTLAARGIIGGVYRLAGPVGEALPDLSIKNATPEEAPRPDGLTPGKRLILPPEQKREPTPEPKP